MTKHILPNDPRYLRELGVDADSSLIGGLVETISNRWKVPGSKPANPTFILFGGFQGSGKSTVIEELSKQLSFIAISPDEIRHELFKKINYSEPVFTHTVHAVRNALIEKAFTTHQHVVLDENATPARLALSHVLAAQHHYRIFSICLDAPKEILEQRVKDRKPTPGRYNGTAEELKVSMDEQPEIDKTQFDMVADTHRQTTEQIRSNVLRILQKGAPQV